MSPRLASRTAVLWNAVALCAALGALPAASARAPTESTAGATSAPAHDYGALARRIVTSTAGIKPGEVVVITGGQHTIPLMEALAVVETKGAQYWPADAAGMVSLGVGSNELYGGENKTQGSYGFAIPHATVAIDGRTVVRDGRLLFGQGAAAAGTR